MNRDIYTTSMSGQPVAYEGRDHLLGLCKVYKDKVEGGDLARQTVGPLGIFVQMYIDKYRANPFTELNTFEDDITAKLTRDE